MTTQSVIQPLASNGHQLATAPNRLGWLEATDPGIPMAALQEQYAAQGYIWLRGILPRHEVIEFRRRFFAAFAKTGLLAPDSDPVDGIYAGGGEDREAVRKLVSEIVQWAAFEAFCMMRPIIPFYEAFMGGPVYLHKRKIVRFTKAGDPNATGAHYDLTYLRAGTDRLCTSWIPIGDIPVEMGGLIYLEGSDSWGREKEAEFALKNAELPYEERMSAYNKNMTEGGWLTKDLPTLADRLDTRWLMANYEAGDMMIHSPYMIHAATTNEDPAGRMRLSTDIRYQLVRDKIDPRWTDHWRPGDML